MSAESEQILSAVDSLSATDLIDVLSRRISSAQMTFERRYAVVALSGGVDSTTVLALASSTLGSEHCRAIFLPDRHSDRDSEDFAAEGARHAGVTLSSRDITGILEELGCYALLDEIGRTVLATFSRDHHTMRTEFVMDLEDPDDLPSYDLVILEGDAEVIRESIGVDLGNQLLAATNLKQRVRMILTYQMAEQLEGFVLNTSNRQELRQGFFVKYGDGAGDLDVLADLYKSQVRAVARELGVSADVADRPSTTDTYSASQTQATFFFGMPERIADLTLAAVDLGCSASALAEAAEVSPQYAERALILVRSRMERARYARHTPQFG